MLNQGVENRRGHGMGRQRIEGVQLVNPHVIHDDEKNVGMPDVMPVARTVGMAAGDRLQQKCGDQSGYDWEPSLEECSWFHIWQFDSPLPYCVESSLSEVGRSGSRGGE